MKILGIIAGIIAVFIWCCCVVAKRADEWLENNHNKGNNN